MNKEEFLGKLRVELKISKNSDYPNLKDIWEETIEEVTKFHESGGYDEINEAYIQ